MSEIRFNNAPVVRATISMPRHGAWIAQVEVASPTAATGRCVLDVDGMLFNGTIRRGGSWQNVCRYSVVGGTNGLPNSIPARFYSNVPLSIPVRDLLTEVGQPISATADNLSLFLQQWVRMAGTAATALETLLTEANASWRILDDGTAWFGSESWPTVNISASVLAEDTAAGMAEVAAATPAFRPGTTWQGRRISYVVHKLAPSSSRTELWFE